ncbi:hypothetical protein NQ314_012139 [Rhamnusium bicolor]|uniref:Uncharacterized protein n=1 Tax=Rhamnusium bicolor TaxID=1586634 RepID=A0AAV8XDZ5_9CUCU|nr:hypothetical protein NQ314_012139 [Rhamnusium bicolor]
MLDSTDLRNLEKEFQLSSSDILGSPRDRRDTTDVLNYHGKKASQPRKEGAHRSPIIHPLVTNKPSSSIPLPVKSPKSPPSKVPSQPLSRSINRSSRPSSVTLNRTSQVTNKHTLEIQFINKKKRLGLLKKDLVEKQKPVLDLYQNLLQIKRRLEELGKVVQLEEVKLMPYNEIQDSAAEVDGRGENISPEVVVGMQSSIEEIPKTLMEICKNLLSRRAVIVDLLESVTKSEVDVGDLSDKIETLKVEGTQLQNNLDAIISEHEKKINELVINWQALLNDKKSMNTNSKIEDLEDKLKAQDKLTQESNQVILDLQRKLDDKRSSHEKSVAELNNVIYTLKEQIIVSNFQKMTWFILTQKTFIKSICIALTHLQILLDINHHLFLF